jgi:hypothetical protein
MPTSRLIASTALSLAVLAALPPAACRWPLPAPPRRRPRRVRTQRPPNWRA